MPGQAPIDTRWSFYRELARRLEVRSRGDDAIAFYLAALTPSLDTLSESSPPRLLRTNKRKHR
jgi:hypothetical protein